jgi:hypothetical protein
MRQNCFEEFVIEFAKVWVGCVAVNCETSDQLPEARSKFEDFGSGHQISYFFDPVTSRRAAVDRWGCSDNRAWRFYQLIARGDPTQVPTF